MVNEKTVVVVLDKSRGGKFYAVRAGCYSVMAYRKLHSTAARDAEKIAERLRAEGHTVVIRDFSN